MWFDVTGGRGSPVTTARIGGQEPTPPYCRAALGTAPDVPEVAVLATSAMRKPPTSVTTRAK